MNRFACLTLAALAASLVLADDAAVKKVLQSRYAEISKAFAEKNAKVFEAGFAPDFTAKGLKGETITRAQFFKDFESQMRMMQDVKWTQTITGLKVNGNVAHVTVDSQMQASFPGQKGEKHAFKLEAKGNKTDWVKGSKGWQVKFSQSTSIKMWMDGKLLSRG